MAGNKTPAINTAALRRLVIAISAQMQIVGFSLELGWKIFDAQMVWEREARLLGVDRIAHPLSRDGE